MPEEEKGFEIRDKRTVRPDGEAAAGTEPKAHERVEETRREMPGPGGDAPAIDFLAFIGSLGATALMHLGEKISPDQPEGGKDLSAAKQMIDLIDLVKEKTKGNLDEEESGMLENLLYNLKVRYVRETARK